MAAARRAPPIRGIAHWKTLRASAILPPCWGYLAHSARVGMLALRFAATGGRCARLKARVRHR